MTTENTPYDALERVFHEPNRLAILSALARSENGVSFTDLKSECELTDGNLSRHIKTLEESKVIRVTKKFVGVRPRTTAFLTANGRRQFVAYLQALEQVLHEAAKSVSVTVPKGTAPLFGRPASAS